MALNRLTANIGGTSYTLVSEDSLSHMRDLVAKVDADITAIMQENSFMSTTMAAVLTAVQNADVATKESRAAKDLRLKLKKLVDEHEALADELAAAKAEAARLREENLALRAKAPATPTAPAAKKAVSADESVWPLSSFEEILDDAEEL